MNRRKVWTQVFLCFLMLMFLVVAAGCSKSDDAPAPTYNISGAVTLTGTALPGVTINLTGATTPATTDASGNYSFTGLANGTYTVTPSKAGYTFNPASLVAVVSGASVTDTTFVATALPSGVSTYSISGTVSGAVLSGVTITLSGAGSATTTTNASGNYSLSGIVNGSYTVTPSMTGYTFAPSSRAATVNGADVTGQNFIATAVPGPPAPTGVSASAGDGQATISWSAVSGATSYTIYWSTTSGVTKTNGTKISGVASPYTHTGLTNSTTYYYIVTAVNSSGESVESAQVSTTPTAGVSWIISTIDSTGDVGSHTSIAVDANEKVHISYYDSTNQTLKYATNSSGSWVATTVASAPSTAYGTSIAIATNGKVHIGYEGTGGNLMYATNSSGNWVTTILESSAWSADVSIALDSNNKVHISYFNLVSFDLKYATNASGTWQTSIVVNGGATLPMPYYSTSIAVDSNNKIHISYYDDASPDSIEYVTNMSGSWVVTRIDTIGLAAGWKTSLAVDSNNKVHVSYYDWTNDAVKYASNASGTWQTEFVKKSSGNASDASLAIDKAHSNQVHMVYGGFMYATKSAGAWQISTIDESWTGSGNSIAIGSSSIHISYYDGYKLNLKYATKPLF